MSASSNFLLGAAALVLAGCASGPRPPEAFPILADRQPLIVVAELDAGEYLRSLPEPPPKPGFVTINFDPPPHWVRAEVHHTIYARMEVPQVLYAGTSSHYGPQPMSPNSQLVFFLTDGRQYIMRRYGYKRLLTKLDGTLLLPVWDKQVSPWLPCSVLELIEEFDSEQVRETLTPRDPDFVFEEQRQDLFRIVPGGFLPRYVIDIRKLTDHLRNNPPPINEIECK
ncbi:hypothetical protein [Pseudoduganella sp. HUAS MS19]